MGLHCVFSRLRSTVVRACSWHSESRNGQSRHTERLGKASMEVPERIRDLSTLSTWKLVSRACGRGCRLDSTCGGAAVEAGGLLLCWSYVMGLAETVELGPSSCDYASVNQHVNMSHLGRRGALARHPMAADLRSDCLRRPRNCVSASPRVACQQLILEWAGD